MIYIHNKTGKRYRWLALATNTTNGAQDGLRMAVYCPDDDEHTIYVRDEREWLAKFSAVESSI